jgi:hypothetical protein
VTPVSVKGDTDVAGNMTAVSSPIIEEPIKRNPLKEPSLEQLALTDSENGDPIERAFEEWWTAYPKQNRVAKEKVLGKYRALVSSKAISPAVLLTAVQQYANSRQVRDGYACAPLKWLNEERWTIVYAAQPDRHQRAINEREEAKATLRRAAADLGRRRGLDAITRATGVEPNWYREPPAGTGPIIDHQPGELS